MRFVIYSVRPAALLLVACVLVLCTSGSVGVAAAAAARNGAGEVDEVGVPPLHIILGQDFEVSVMTRTYGVFNATLYVSGSVSFPERLHAELVPHGEVVLSYDSQRKLPHFSRPRGLVDETRTTGAARRGRGGDDAVALSRPTLLTADILLQYGGASAGTAKVYYMPVEEDALRHLHESIDDGTAVPTATVDFAFHPVKLPGTVIIGDAALAQQTATSVTLQAGSKTAAGTLTMYLFSEHEFNVVLSLPVTTEEGTTVMEPVWVHGYTAPNPEVYNREKKQSFMGRYGVTVIVLVGFVMQMLTAMLTDRARPAATATSATSTSAAAPAAVTEAKKRS